MRSGAAGRPARGKWDVIEACERKNAAGSSRRLVLSATGGREKGRAETAWWSGPKRRRGDHGTTGPLAAALYGGTSRFAAGVRTVERGEATDPATLFKAIAGPSPPKPRGAMRLNQHLESPTLRDAEPTKVIAGSTPARSRRPHRISR